MSASFDTFYEVASYSSSVEGTAEVYVLNMGDGYKQRTPKDYQITVLKFLLVFRNISEERFDRIHAFLERNREKDFAWVMPRSFHTPVHPYHKERVIVCCDEWKHTYVSFGVYNMSMIFEQKFNKPEEFCIATTGDQIYAQLPFTRVCFNGPLETIFLKDKHLDYCYGPQFENAKETEYRTRWAAWSTPSGIRYGKYEDGEVIFDQYEDDVTPEPDFLGARTDLYPDEYKPAWLSLSFDQDAHLVLAVQKDEETIEIRRRSQGILLSYTFEGFSPLLFFNYTTNAVETGDSDVVCFYLHPSDTTKLMARFQRDNFGVAYVFDIAPIAMEYLVKTDLEGPYDNAVEELYYQLLWSISVQGTDMKWRSRVYRAQKKFPHFMREDGRLMYGDYRYSIISETVPSYDAAELNASISAGEYKLIVVAPEMVEELAFLTTQFLSGLYKSVIISEEIEDDEARSILTSALFSGLYNGNMIEEDISVLFVMKAHEDESSLFGEYIYNLNRIDDLQDESIVGEQSYPLTGIYA
jgi:phage-related protein